MKVPQKLKKKLIFKDINQDSDLHDPEMCESYKHNHEWQHISAETLRYRINKTIAKFEVTGIYKDDLCQLLHWLLVFYESDILSIEINGKVSLL